MFLSFFCCCFYFKIVTSASNLIPALFQLTKAFIIVLVNNNPDLLTSISESIHVVLHFWLLKYNLALMSDTIMVSKPHIIKLQCNVLLVAGSGFSVGAYEREIKRFWK